MHIVANVDPLEVIKNNTKATNISLIANFISILKHLYQFEIFKDILDVVVTKAYIGQLEFHVNDMNFYSLAFGTCQTITSSIGFKKKYIITIKKIAANVIMHEIGHMLEQELARFLDLKKIADIILYEINHLPNQYIGYFNFLNSLFITQLKSYPTNQHNSEIFARFLEGFASTKDISYNSYFDCRFWQLLEVFTHSNKIIDMQLKQSLTSLIDNNIAIASQKYIKDISDIKKWAIEKGEIKKWSKSIKSLQNY